MKTVIMMDKYEWDKIYKLVSNGLEYPEEDGKNIKAHLRLILIKLRKLDCDKDGMD